MCHFRNRLNKAAFSVVAAALHDYNNSEAVLTHLVTKILLTVRQLNHQTCRDYSIIFFFSSCSERTSNMTSYETNSAR